ncbi:hypothetical protein CMI37_00020 [Candidatus Pacearchaeota archaeon]|nr:hypothetical protein [Candidatus Pacearchaeota archaeon]
MAEITKLQIAELDFDTIKGNLKDYFGSQTEFTDHNFDGSAISVLLDILAYNTHYNAYYLNMLASESFLDSAQLRDSVVTKASMLGYTPRSARGSKANVNLTITPGDAPASITIDRFTQFTSTVNGTAYTFCTANSVVITPSSGVYSADTVELSQGIPLTFKYTADTANTEQKFLLPNANTDTDTLTVTIQESVTDTNTAVYALATDITTVNATSNVYFMSEHTDGQFRVQFGDGVLGRKPISGNIIILKSLVTEGTNTNGANVFSAASTVGGYSTVAVVTANSAVGGLDKESVESIKFNAPKNYETQNRAVTTGDYKKIVEDSVSGLDTVAVWGGQDDAVPKYGTVYVSAKPSGADALSTSQKALITSSLADYNIVAISPEVVDPDLINLIFSLTVKYDSRKTTKASGVIAANVIDTIQDYKTNNLNKFGSIFRYSVLSKLIDNTDTSLLGNLLTLTAKKGITPSTTANNSYTISFNNAIYNPSATYEGAVTSSAFAYTDSAGTTYSTSYLDDLNGVMRIYYLSGSDKLIIANSVGTVTYSNGHITLTSFMPDSFSGSTLDFTITPATNDLIPIRNQLFTVSNTNITVTMQDDADTGTTTTSASATGTSDSVTTGTATGSSTTY